MKHLTPKLLLCLIKHVEYCPVLAFHNPTVYGKGVLHIAITRAVRKPHKVQNQNLTAQAEHALSFLRTGDIRWQLSQLHDAQFFSEQANSSAARLQLPPVMGR